MALAERCGLADLVREHVKITSQAGVNADLKAGCLVAGMAAGADSIDDMDLLRHGAMTEVFGGIRAPSTLGSFLRSFRWGNVRQLDAVARLLLAELAWAAPLLPGGDVLAFIDMDSMQKRVYGHAKQGAGFGHTKIQGKSLTIRGLNALAAVISTPLAAPVIAATRLRGGTANSARGAASLAAEAIGTARQAGCSGQLVFRIDSAYYSAAVLGTIRAGGACFSVTVRMDPKIRAAIAAIGEDAWTAITYPRAVWDEDQKRLISDPEAAEVPYTAFASKKANAITPPPTPPPLRDPTPPLAATRRGPLPVRRPEGWPRGREWTRVSKPAGGPPPPAARPPQPRSPPSPGPRGPPAGPPPAKDPDKPQNRSAAGKPRPEHHQDHLPVGRHSKTSVRI